VPTDQLASVLRRIAGTVSSSLELKDVFGRIAESAAEVIPFDAMVVQRHDRDGVLEVHSLVGALKGPPQETLVDEFSPSVREFFTAGGRIDDFEPLIDVAYAQDRLLRADRLRSAMAMPIRRGGRLAAVVAVGSRQIAAFTENHESALRSIADLVGLALEHERLWTLDLARRRRLDAVDALLPTLAKALDVRAIFNQVSAVVQPVLAHDRLMLASLSADRRTITVDALSGEPVPDISRPTSAPTECTESDDLEPEVVADLEAAPEEDRCSKSRLLGVRSLLRVPMRLPDGRAGALVFLAKKPNAYGDEDVLVARRVTEYVSLALSYQRLAEEERIAADAKERASRLEMRVEELRVELAASRGYRRVVGESKAWSDVLKQATQVAPTEATVLLTGESGTGKEVVARFIHGGSPRSKGPFVALNCAALPESLLESELFGHEKGAFTGATASRAGSIEQAAGGLLFLDEVAEMSRTVQAKLLRVLQEREYQPLGATKPRKADVRVVAATNRDLQSMISHGEFREDLYYRLQVFEIRLPPLRERADDILVLAESFLEELGQLVGRPAAGFAKDARDALFAYRWPGNVRELRNVLERATILCDGGLITSEHLPRDVANHVAAVVHAATAVTTDALPFDLEAVERVAVVRALAAAGNNRSQAARLLGIARQQLYHRLRKFGLDDAPPAA
jgi:transcriptional regulator with GAF, ATPase, and Fis domain